MSALLTAAAAGLAAAALGVSLWALWRGLRGQALTAQLVRDALAEIDSKLTPPPPPEPPKDYEPMLETLREDLTAIASHVGALTAGQADLRAAVGAAAAASLNDLAQQMTERMAESDKRAVARNETLRDEQQRVIERVEAAEAAIRETLAARAVAAAGEDGAPPADALDAPMADDLKAAVREACAEALAGLREALATDLRKAAGGGPARAPAIFNSGKVVSLVAEPKPGAAPAEHARATPAAVESQA